MFFTMPVLLKLHVLALQVHAHVHHAHVHARTVTLHLMLANRDRHRVAFWTRVRVVREPETPSASFAAIPSRAGPYHEEHFERAGPHHEAGFDAYERVLPVFYSDNYVTLVPGEQARVRIEFERPARELESELPVGERPSGAGDAQTRKQRGQAWVLIKGMNVPFQAIRIHA